MEPNEQSPDSHYVAYDYVPWWQQSVTRWIVRGLVILGILTAILGPPIWRGRQQRLAQEDAAAGEQMLALGRLSEAYDHALRGGQRDPGSPRVLRLTAQVLAQAESPAGLGYWSRLLERPDASLEDRAGYVELALALDEPSVAEAEVKRLLAVPDPSARVRLLATRYHLLQNDLREALEQSQALRREHPEAAAGLLDLGTLLDAHPDPAVVAEARNIFIDLARSPGVGPPRLDALERLIHRSGATTADRRLAAGILAELEPDVLRHQVLLADARMELDPAEARAIALAALARLQPTSDEEMLTVVNWLHRHQLFDQTLILLTSERVRDRPQLASHRRVALQGIGQLAAAYRESLRDRHDADPLSLELERCHLAVRLKDERAARNHEDKLWGMAARKPARLRQVAEYARARGMDDLAARACKSLTFDPLEGPRATQILARLVDASGDTWAAREYVRRLSTLDPGNAVRRLQVAHYDVLLGENLRPAVGLAESVLERPDLRLTARLVAAYGCLRLEERERTRNHMAKIPLPNHPLPPHLAALHVALLGATGRESQARALAGSLTNAALRPEERELIRPYQGP